MAFATINNILEYEPNILDYGIQNFDDSLTKSQSDIERHLRIHWWPTMQVGRFDITIIGTYSEMNPDLLTESQFTRACVYHALGYYIFPQLSKFEPDLDVFQMKLDYYKKMFAEEIDLVIRDGVEYDLDSSGTIDDAEKTPQYFLRLKR